MAELLRSVLDELCTTAPICSRSSELLAPPRPKLLNLASMGERASLGDRPRQRRQNVCAATRASSRTLSIRGRHRLVLGGSHPQAPLTTIGTHTPAYTLNAHKRQVSSIALAELAMPK